MGDVERSAGAPSAGTGSGEAMREARVLGGALSLSVLVMSSGCASNEPVSPELTVCPANQPNCGRPPPLGTGVGGGASGQPLAGTGGSVQPLPTAGSQSTMTPGGGSGGVPCDVARVVSDNCTLCHAAT